MRKEPVDVTVGVIEKVKIIYTAKKVAGLIKVNVIKDIMMVGRDIEIYYSEINEKDRVYINGIEYSITSDS